MQPAPQSPPGKGLDEDLSRLRNLFASSFPVSEELGQEMNDLGKAEKLPDLAESDQDFDWSVTLNHINDLTEAAKASEARVQAIEERALRAEARAMEAEHWLRRLHQAVLDGLPYVKRTAA